MFIFHTFPISFQLNSQILCLWTNSNSWLSFFNLPGRLHLIQLLIQTPFFGLQHPHTHLPYLRGNDRVANPVLFFANFHQLAATTTKYTMKSYPPLSKRLLQVSCAIVWCLLAAGPVFGFAALKPILIKEGIYHEKCPPSSNKGSGEPCVVQDLLLNKMFTLAAVFTNVAALPVGYILDEYGPKISGIIGSGLIFLGSLLLRLGSQVGSSWFDPYLVGYTFLALGGPFVFISCFQLANSFPKNSGLILALLTGAFDSSLALFLIYRLIYTNIHKVTLNQFFTYYMVVPLFILGCQLTIMPSDSYKTMGTLAKIGTTGIDETGRPIDEDLLSVEDRETDDEIVHPQPTVTESTALLMRRASFSRRESTVSRASFASRNSIKSVYEQDAETKLVHSTGGIFGIMHGYDISDQLKSPWFVLMTLFTTIQMLRINYFVATIKSQELYLYHGDEELATKINHFFDLALPLGGLASIPFIGVLLDNFTTLTILCILTVVSLFIGVMGLLSWIPATYAGILMLVVYRPFYYTSVSDFCAKVFGFETFGTVYGAIICFSGICNLLQLAMDHATHETFGMNPTPINAILTGLTAVFGLILIQYVRSSELALRRNNLELEAQKASTRSIPTQIQN